MPENGLLSLSSWCVVSVLWLFLAVPWVSLKFVIVVFPDHTHILCLLSPRNHEDISYLKEQSKLSEISDVCTPVNRALVCNSLLVMLLHQI